MSLDFTPKQRTQTFLGFGFCVIVLWVSILPESQAFAWLMPYSGLWAAYIWGLMPASYMRTFVLTALALLHELILAMPIGSWVITLLLIYWVAHDRRAFLTRRNVWIQGTVFFIIAFLGLWIMHGLSDFASEGGGSITDSFSRLLVTIALFPFVRPVFGHIVSWRGS